ncbi:MAG: flagellar biosynthesis protein FlhA [Ignavibacteriales bacterium]|nr:flagellar biosynthesis protein FlhA [Ignavibacteriales bacterium]
MKRIFENTDILFAFGFVFILALMLVPIPPFMLDYFLALNITLAVLVLITAIYIQEPLEISVFPGLLLTLTLFRLGLNVSSTRLILIDAYAGQVIETFGSFVVGGSYIVGFLVFVILVIINFLVIVKGSERISEVAARFTLDGMPGKQMAIDADLNAGLINEEEAKERRETVARQAEFHGAMDGASKFVKGDAIAGIVITIINIIGGFIIGAVQMGMTITEAMQTYTILTIGDGLVTQIPALLISTSAGVVVSKGGQKASMDSQFKEQLLGNPRVLAVVAGAVALFAVVPGMPTIPFLLLAVGAGAGAYVRFRQQQRARVIEEAPEPAEETPEEERVEEYLQVDPIEVEIGYGLISLVDEQQGGNLFQKIGSTRKLLALEYGVLIPPVRVRDNLRLNPNDYLIKIKGNVVARSEIYADRFLAMNPGNIEEKLGGVPTTDPAFGLEAYWIVDEEKERAELLGYTVVDSISVLSTHLQETIKKNFDRILSRQMVKDLLENLKKEHPAVVEDVNPEVLPLGMIQKVLQGLLAEGVPIKDLATILESLIDYAKVTKNVDVLIEYVRHSLGQTIASLYKDHLGVLHAVAVGEDIERRSTASIQEQKEATPTLGFAPEELKALSDAVAGYMENFKTLGYTPVFLTAATVRPYLYRLLTTSFPDIAVLSFSELPSDLEVEFIGKLEL